MLSPALLQAKSIANITADEAATLAVVRRRVGDLYGIRPVGTDAATILGMAKGELVDG